MKGIFKNLLFILILGSVSATLLLGIRAYTLPKIERYQEVTLKRTVLEAAGIDYDEENLDSVFRKNIKEKRKNGFVHYISPDNSYIFEFEGRGLWGMIKGLVTLDSDLTTIENIKILSQEETPGLGGRIAEESFLRQFKGKSISPQLFLTLRRKAVKGNEVDAISGASITSQALIEMINKVVIDFREVLAR